MMKLVTFELSVKKKYSLKVKIVWIPLPFIEEALYSMRGMVICLVTVPNVEESGELGVTFITAVKVTWVGRAGELVHP